MITFRIPQYYGSFSKNSSAENCAAWVNQTQDKVTAVVGRAEVTITCEASRDNLSFVLAIFEAIKPGKVLFSAEFDGVTYERLDAWDLLTRLLPDPYHVALSISPRDFLRRL